MSAGLPKALERDLATATRTDLRRLLFAGSGLIALLLALWAAFPKERTKRELQKSALLFFPLFSLVLLFSADLIAWALSGLPPWEGLVVRPWTELLQKALVAAIAFLLVVFTAALTPRDFPAEPKKGLPRLVLLFAACAHAGLLVSTLSNAASGGIASEFGAELPLPSSVTLTQALALLSVSGLAARLSSLLLAPLAFYALLLSGPAALFSMPAFTLGLALGAEPRLTLAWPGLRRAGWLMALLGLAVGMPFPLRYFSWGAFLPAIGLGLLPWACAKAKAEGISARAAVLAAALYAAFGLNGYLRVPKAGWDTPRLIAALKSSSVSDSGVAALLLEKRGAKAAPELLALLREEPGQRDAIVRILTSMKGTPAERLPLLLAVIRDPENSAYQRQRAIRQAKGMTAAVVGPAGHAELVAAIIDALSDSDKYVRQAAAETAASIAETRGKP